MNQYCESCKYYYRVTEGVGVCSVEPGPYKDVPYERRACRFYEYGCNYIREDEE